MFALGAYCSLSREQSPVGGACPVPVPVPGLQLWSSAGSLPSGSGCAVMWPGTEAQTHSLRFGAGSVHGRKSVKRRARTEPGSFTRGDFVFMVFVVVVVVAAVVVRLRQRPHSFTDRGSTRLRVVSPKPRSAPFVLFIRQRPRDADPAGRRGGRRGRVGRSSAGHRAGKGGRWGSTRPRQKVVASDGQRKVWRHELLLVGVALKDQLYKTNQV